MRKYKCINKKWIFGIHIQGNVDSKYKISSNFYVQIRCSKILEDIKEIITEI